MTEEKKKWGGGGGRLKVIHDSIWMREDSLGMRKNSV